QEDIETARAKTNYKNMEISTSPASVRFLNQGMGVDSGGIGKGYALDRALAMMQMFPIQSATLNFGGEILYWSQEAQKKTVGIRDPLRQQTMRETWVLTISTSATAVSTSANYERSVRASDSKSKWGHLLDPRSGRPVENGVRSVTVVSESATEADALSTAIFVLGLAEGTRFIEAQNLMSLILYEQNGKLRSYYSRNWKKLAAKVG
ncbi:MAG: FAD:protein FMN transferase, partial [Elusimicrobia bacterium]|nr:FAD:protein FMN transferase [Elusimicrobiota bacterium]